MEKQGIEAHESDSVKNTGCKHKEDQGARLWSHREGFRVGWSCVLVPTSCGTVNEVNHLPDDYQFSQFESGDMWGVVTHDCTPSTWDGKTQALQTPGTLGLHSKCCPLTPRETDNNVRK